MNFETFKANNKVPTLVILSDVLTGIFHRDKYEPWNYYLSEEDLQNGDAFNYQGDVESFEDFILDTLQKIICHEIVQQQTLNDYFPETAIDYDIQTTKYNSK